MHRPGFLFQSINGKVKQQSQGALNQNTNKEHFCIHRLESRTLLWYNYSLEKDRKTHWLRLTLSGLKIWIHSFSIGKEEIIDKIQNYGKSYWRRGSLKGKLNLITNYSYNEIVFVVLKSDLQKNQNKYFWEFFKFLIILNALRLLHPASNLQKREAREYYSKVYIVDRYEEFG